MMYHVQLNFSTNNVHYNRKTYVAFAQRQLILNLSGCHEVNNDSLMPTKIHIKNTLFSFYLKNYFLFLCNITFKLYEKNSLSVDIIFITPQRRFIFF